MASTINSFCDIKYNDDFQYNNDFIRGYSLDFTVFLDKRPKSRSEHDIKYYMIKPNYKTFTIDIVKAYPIKNVLFIEDNKTFLNKCDHRRGRELHNSDIYNKEIHEN